MLALMTSAEYRHLSPKQLVPRLADEGRYLASESTMYRLDAASDWAPAPADASHGRDAGRTVHRAVRPNQVWSWDITYLPTVIRGRFLRLYLVMDVWSRRIVGWEVHDDELAERAATLIQRICADSGVDPHGLVLHSDNGKPMRGNTMIATLQWLGIVPSFSRPHVCNDNPYSEALFRTLKHTPAYPRLPFASRDAARQWVARFVAGTTPSIGTARFGMSRQTNDTPAPMSPSWRVVARSTNAPGADPGALVRQDSKLGTRRRLWSSTRSPRRKDSMRHPR